MNYERNSNRANPRLCSRMGGGADSGSPFLKMRGKVKKEEFMKYKKTHRDTSMKAILSLFLSLLLFSCYSKKPAIGTEQLNKASKQLACRRQEKSALDYEQRAEEQELSAKHNKQKAALLNISDKSSDNDKKLALDYEQEAERQELSAKHNRQRAKALKQR